MARGERERDQTCLIQHKATSAPGCQLQTCKTNSPLCCKVRSWKANVVVKHSLAPSLGRKVQDQIMLVLFSLVSSSSSVLPCLASKDSDTAMVSQGSSESPASLLCPGRDVGRTDHSHTSSDLPGRVFREEMPLQCWILPASQEQCTAATAVLTRGVQWQSTQEHRVWRSNIGAVGSGWFPLLWIRLSSAEDAPEGTHS